VKFLSKTTVIARLVRATQFSAAAKLGRPHEAGDDGFVYEALL
jgi:hypothetical protein